ncbi:hypothetical protein BN2127_JRS1_00764 [Bacillus cereus]|nr:hypothetical protein BN2127_JRS1_00764 [Bacillus cereus]
MTGGIGAASASTADTVNKSNETKLLACYPKNNEGKYVKEVRQNHQYFDNTRTETDCGGTVVWYLKKSSLQMQMAAHILVIMKDGLNS